MLFCYTDRDISALDCFINRGNHHEAVASGIPAEISMLLWRLGRHWHGYGLYFGKISRAHRRFWHTAAKHEHHGLFYSLLGMPGGRRFGSSGLAGS